MGSGCTAEVDDAGRILAAVLATGLLAVSMVRADF
jgi:hypothetical protein